MDDLSTLGHDTSGFLQLVLGFPEQVERAVEIGRSARVPTLNAAPTNVVLVGMGGSAAGGDFLQALFDAQGGVPFAVSRTYGPPNWVGEGSLVLACSYSGDTEETLESYFRTPAEYRTAQDTDYRPVGAKFVVTTSGGTLHRAAETDGFPVVVVPGGQPPRTALGYMLVPGVVLCSRLGLVPDQPWEEVASALRHVRAACGPEVGEGNPAKSLARELVDKVPVVYGQSGWTAAVANRWRGQINENSKAMCHSHVFPELCHNEILGWTCSARQGDWHVCLLDGGDESDQMRRRVDETLALTGAPYTRVYAPPGGLLTKMLALAYVGDFVSLYLAELLGQDPAQMDAIVELKRRLS